MSIPTTAPGATASPVYRVRAPINVYLIGAAGVGKTTILERFCHPDQEHIATVSTIGTDFYPVKGYRVSLPRVGASGTNGTAVKTGTRARKGPMHYEVTLNLWDTGGDENFRATTKVALRRAEIVIYTFDVSETLPYATCMAIPNVWHGISGDAGLLDRPYAPTAHEMASGVRPLPFFAMVGNKVDRLSDKRPPVPDTVMMEAFSRTTQHEAEEWPITAPLTVSGYNGQSVQDAFRYIVSAYLERERTLGRLRYVGDGTDVLEPEVGHVGQGKRGGAPRSSGASHARASVSRGRGSKPPRGTVRVIGAEPSSPRSSEKSSTCCA